MKKSESTEMYLETVYILEKKHGHAHVVDIANMLDVSKPSVTKAVKNLEANNLVHCVKYGSITLTEEGRKIAIQIYKKHKMIQEYLRHSLNLSSEQASKNACKIEHSATDEMILAVEKYLKENNINL